MLDVIFVIVIFAVIDVIFVVIFAVIEVIFVINDVSFVIINVSFTIDVAILLHLSISISFIIIINCYFSFISGKFLDAARTRPEEGRRLYAFPRIWGSSHAFHMVGIVRESAITRNKAHLSLRTHVRSCLTGIEGRHKKIIRKANITTNGWLSGLQREIEKLVGYQV